MSGGRALDGARRDDARPGAVAGGPRRRARGARGGEGAPARLRRRAVGEPGRPVGRAVPAGPARGGQVVAGASGRRRARASLRVGGLRGAGLGGGGARVPRGPAGTDRRGATARRRPQSGVRARRGRSAGRVGRRVGGAARSGRPDAVRRVLRPLPGPADRPVRGAVRGDGEPARLRAAGAAGTDAAGGRAAQGTPRRRSGSLRPGVCCRGCCGCTG